jgi:hypothetical protein
MEDFLTNRQQRVVINNTQSNLKTVTSGIPQGSVLGPTLFIIFINDLPDVCKSYVKIFADDTKIFNAIEASEDSEILQEDINQLVNWSHKWQLKFNADKCKVIHYGSNNPNTPYTLNGMRIEDSKLEKDLGVSFDNNLKFSPHVGNIVAKANSRLAIIKRTMHDLSPEVFLPLYKSLVRPLLEYCSPVWSPMLKKDQIEIEKVQRRATKLVKSISHMEYSERLFYLKLDSLHFRRRRSDMIQVFRIINGFDGIDPSSFFTFFENSRTRGHKHKIFKPNTNCRVRTNTFSQRIINDLNSLSPEVVNTETINSFKSTLKKFWVLHLERLDMP